MKYILLLCLPFSAVATPLTGFICTGSFHNEISVYHLSLEFSDNGRGYYRVIHTLSNKKDPDDEMEGVFQYDKPLDSKWINITSERKGKDCSVNNTSEIPFIKCGNTLVRGAGIANSIRLVDYGGTIMICTPPP